MTETTGAISPTQTTWLTNRVADLEHDLERARTLLARYQQVVVPRADYDRATERAMAAERNADDLTREVANLRDRRTQTTADRALSALQRVLDLMGRTAWGDAERRVLRDANAVLVEAGRNPYLPEVDHAD
jgi:hypothetical protein